MYRHCSLYSFSFGIDPSFRDYFQSDNKKPLNLYIYGEYDVLNDLVNDGAKRLSKSKNLSDLDLLVQNDPCPPPDRWVRPTGWSRCNPSSCYAANPPEGYDLNSYNTNSVKLPGEEEEETATAMNNTYSTIPEPSKMSPKDSEGTQTTAAVSGSTSEDLFDRSSGKVPSKTSPNESARSLKQSATSTTTTAASRTKVASGGGIPDDNNGSKKKKSVTKRISGIFK